MQSAYRGLGFIDLTASVRSVLCIGRLKEAKDLICSLLADGKEVYSADIDREAVKQGISTRTVRDAKAELGAVLKSRYRGGHRKLYSREQRAKRTSLLVHLATAARVKYPAPWGVQTKNKLSHAP